MSDWANRLIKDRPKSWWAQTKLQSTEQRGFWQKMKSVAHWTVMTWTVQGNQRWSQGLTTTEESTEAADGPRRGTMLQGQPVPAASPWNTTAALFCITGNCNIVLNLLVYDGWLCMCFLGPVWQGHVANQHVGWKAEAVLNDLHPECCLISWGAHLKITAQMRVSQS